MKFIGAELTLVNYTKFHTFQIDYFHLGLNFDQEI